jgi:SAM-dependent methyltransferase
VTGDQGRFTQWMFDTIKPYVRGRVLEVGSGIGTFSARLRTIDRNAVFSDVDPDFLRRLRRRFPKNTTLSLDISDPKQMSLARSLGPFDTIVFLNVLEHVEDDVRALRLLRTLLSPTGRIVCLVPTHKFLYNPIDESLGHYRRYTKEELAQKVRTNGYRIEDIFAFNVFAIPGWFVTGNLLRRRTVNPGAMRLFNWFVPVFSLLDRVVLRRRIGISTIVVASPATSAAAGRRSRS